MRITAAEIITVLPTLPDFKYPNKTKSHLKMITLNRLQ